jgi:hypothetical protein
LLLVILCPLVFIGINIGYNTMRPPPEIWVGTGSLRIPSEYKEVFLRQITKSIHQDRILESAGLPRGLDDRAAALFRKSLAAKHIPETTVVEVSLKGYQEKDVNALIEATLDYLLAFQVEFGEQRLATLKARLNGVEGLMSDVVRQREALAKQQVRDLRFSRESIISTLLIKLLDTQLNTQLTELKMSQERIKYEHDSLVAIRLGKSVVSKQIIRSTVTEGTIIAGLMGFAVAFGLIAALYARRRKADADEQWHDQ